MLVGIAGAFLGGKLAEVLANPCHRTSGATLVAAIDRRRDPHCWVWRLIREAHELSARRRSTLRQPLAAAPFAGSKLGSVMAVVLDSQQPARRAIRKRRTGRTAGRCASRTGSGSGRRARRLCRDATIVREHSLVTVCEEAGCPNIGECWDKKHATFMIMGDICTRACAFCNVQDRPAERARSATSRRMSREAVAKLGLAHVVITSVDRDDLADGGAEHFAQVIRAIRARTPGDDDRNADARFPAQGRRARRSSSRRGPTSSTTISRRCRRNI